MASPQTYYQLLDVAIDAKRDEIALGYQRALEALARDHDTDPKTRAALRKAFEVLVDPVQRMSYDLSGRSAQAVTQKRSRDENSDEARTLIGRVWASGFGKVFIGGLILLGLIFWMRSGKPSSGGALPGGAQPTPLAAGAATTGDGSGDTAATSKADTKSISAGAAPSGPRTAEDIFNQVSQSVVRINVANSAGAPVASGSGVVIGPGAVITNCHVALRGDTLEVKLGGVSYSASVEVANEERDLCLLNVVGLRAPAVSLGSIDSLRVGQRVYAVGAPQGLDLTISDGIVSGLREMQGGKMIQTTAPVSPGSSGGGLFDTSGRMVGVVTFQNKVGQNLNFAVPADWVGEMRTR